MSEGYIYFAHANRGDTILFKVGYSKHPKWRMKELGDTLVVSVQGSIESEQAIHEMLATYRVTGEWYRAGRRLHRLIAYCCIHGELPACIVEVGRFWLENRLAKRALNQSLRLAGEFFSDDSNFGVDRGSDPFAQGRKMPPTNDISWLKRMHAASHIDITGGSHG
jgi:hypothetical protein